MLRTIWGDNQRYIDTYWEKFDGRYYVAGDSAYRDEDGCHWIMEQELMMCSMSQATVCRNDGGKIGLVANEMVAKQLLLEDRMKSKRKHLCICCDQRRETDWRRRKKNAGALGEWVKLNKWMVC